MELKEAKKLIKKYAEGHSTFVKKVDTAYRYYRKQNDILFLEKHDKDAEGENPLRTADNRIPSNFYKLEVNQKAAYAFTTPPQFDVGDDSSNDVIKQALGDAFAKKCKTLCVQAANCSIGWLHYWRDEKKQFKYSVVDAKQVIPVFTKNLEKELKAVLRVYEDIDETDGATYIVYEYWTDTQSESFRRRIDQGLEELQYYEQYLILDVDTGSHEETNMYNHDFGEVPFIFFNNNDEQQNDLADIKELIDSYDKVYSGFINDLEDIQEIIFILTNYSGEDDSAASVLKQMKKKVIHLESEGPDDRSGIETLAIEIPVEARKEILNVTRKAIFEQGMGIDPDPQNFGNSSGVALSYLYSLLELKTGMMQTEFEISFNRLIRAILRFHGKSAGNIKQTWKRSSVSNNAELAEIASMSKGIISNRTIAKNHPWVEDPIDEMEQMEKEEGEGIRFDEAPIIEESGDIGDGKEE